VANVIKLEEKILNYLNTRKKVIDKRIDEWLHELNLSDENISYVFEGGKRLRSLLTLLIGETLGINLEKLVDLATAIEFVHNATLIHDDIIDAHDMRRGKSSLWRISGQHKAVIMGDLLFSYAGYRLAKISEKALKIITNAIYRVSLGVFLEDNPLAGRKYGYRIYEMINRLKTAELFGAAAELGVVLLNDQAIQKQAYNFGIHIGEAYQLADDLVDISLFLDRKRDVDLKPIKLLIGYLKEDEKIIDRFFKDREVDRDELRNHLKAIKAKEKLASLIKEKIVGAEESLLGFPENEYKNILYEIPRSMVNAMLEEYTKPPL
jgi:octaprenyl-diphosphate synthase